MFRHSAVEGCAIPNKNKLEMLMDFSEREMNLACDGYWGICTEGRRFVVNDDDERFLSFRH